MSDQNDVQRYRDREAAERARADRTVDPAARERIVELAQAYAAVAETQQALSDLDRQKRQRSPLDGPLGPSR